MSCRKTHLSKVCMTQKDVSDCESTSGFIYAGPIPARDLFIDKKMILGLSIIISVSKSSAVILSVVDWEEMCTYSNLSSGIIVNMRYSHSLIQIRDDSQHHESMVKEI